MGECTYASVTFRIQALPLNVFLLQISADIRSELIQSGTCCGLCVHVITSFSVCSLG